MALAPGSKLGVYEVTAKIGAGGMGEVYRAHDTTLDRDVAIKVLPNAFATDPEHIAAPPARLRSGATASFDTARGGKGLRYISVRGC